MDASLSNYLFTQGVLGVACLVLGIVIVYQQRKNDKKDLRIDELHATILALVTQHSAEYHELAKETTEVMRQDAQNIAILSEKIQIGKR